MSLSHLTFPVAVFIDAIQKCWTAQHVSCASATTICELFGVQSLECSNTLQSYDIKYTVEEAKKPYDPLWVLASVMSEYLSWSINIKLHEHRPQIAWKGISDFLQFVSSRFTYITQTHRRKLSSFNWWLKSCTASYVWNTRVWVVAPPVTPWFQCWVNMKGGAEVQPFRSIQNFWCFMF